MWERSRLTEDPAIFGVGTNWSCSFRAFVVHLTGTPASQADLHRGGAGFIDYVVGSPQINDGSILTAAGSGYQIEYADGPVELFQKAFTNTILDRGVTRAFFESQHFRV